MVFNFELISIIIVASIIGIAYLYKIRSYDIYEKEPFLKLLIVALFGGLISVFTSLFLYKFVSVERDFVDAIIKIGLIEEVSKLIALAILYKLYIKKDFNEIVDGLIYITAVSLGFAIIENVFYAYGSTQPFDTLFKRSVFAVAGHISFSGYMGIAYYIHKKVHKNYIGLVLSVALAALAHGLYDGVIFEQHLNILFQFVFITLVLLQLRMLRTILGFSKFRHILDNDTFKISEETKFSNCTKCDISVKSKSYTFWKIKAARCDKCNNLVFDSNDCILLFTYFRPMIRPHKFFKKLDSKKKVVFFDKDEQLAYNNTRKFLSADPTTLGKWLEQCNAADKKRVLNIPVIGLLLKNLGLKYM